MAPLDCNLKLFVHGVEQSSAIILVVDSQQADDVLLNITALPPHDNIGLSRGDLRRHGRKKRQIGRPGAISLASHRVLQMYTIYVYTYIYIYVRMDSPDSIIHLLK